MGQAGKRVEHRVEQRVWNFGRYRYLIAVASVVGALVVKILVESILPHDFPFLFFFTAVVVSSWIGGLKPGLLATGLSALLSTGVFSGFLFGQPWMTRMMEVERIVGLIVFVIEGGIVAAVFQSLHTSRERLGRAVREAEESRQVAEESNQAKKDFIANLSHEIRTPLMGIVGYTELILKPDLPEAERQRYVPKIQANVRDLSLLVEDILAITAIERGGVEPDRTAFGLEGFIRSLNKDLRPLADQKGIRLEFRTKGFLPLEVESDPKKLHQILAHVIGSSIRYTQGETVSVTLTLRRQKRPPSSSSQAPGAFLAFIVRSEGPWETQTAGTNGSIAGAGSTELSPFDEALERGLPLARRLALALGGDIKAVTNKRGNGHTFLVTMPIPFAPDFETTVQEVILKSMPEKSRADVDEHPLEGVKVLLVEDSADSRYLVSRFLDMAGAEVETARNGQEGVEKACHGDYNVVVMDIQMPVLDGNHAAQELREKNFRKPLIALSAHALHEDQKAALDSGFNDYIVKPVNRADLIEKVSRYALH